MDEEDVPKFSKLLVIPKVQELQKFGARKQGKIFHQSDHKYCFVYDVAAQLVFQHRFPSSREILD